MISNLCFRLSLVYCSTFVFDNPFVDLSWIKQNLLPGLKNSPRDDLTRKELDTLTLALFNFCTLPTSQTPLVFCFLTHTTSFTSIPTSVECCFQSYLSVGRHSCKRRDQILFMILLALFHCFP